MKGQTPSPNRYKPQADNMNFRKNNVSTIQNEKKFFETKDMPNLRSRLPIQYTSCDGVSPLENEISASSRGSKLSMYIGGSQSSKYR